MSGLPNPELMWLVNGRPVYPDLYHKMLVRENGVHSLVIDPLTQKDAGTYTCIASNKAGQSSFSLELQVVGKDRIRLGLLLFDNPNVDISIIHIHFRKGKEAPTPVCGEAAEHGDS